MSLFKDHGTKILGGLTTALGVLGTVDPTVLAGALGPKGMSYVTAVAGILTVLRGVQNTNAQNTPQPPVR